MIRAAWRLLILSGPAQVSVTGPNYRPRPHDANTFCGRSSASPTPSVDVLARANHNPNPTLGAHAASVAAAAKAATAADAAVQARGAPGVGAGAPEGGPGPGLGLDAGRQGSGAAAALLSMLGGGSLGAVRAPTSAPMQARPATSVATSCTVSDCEDARCACKARLTARCR